MTPEVWFLLAAGALLLLLGWMVWLRTRLARLEQRVAQAWVALDRQLRRRAELAADLARAHPAALGAPAAAELAAAAQEALAPRSGDRELAENALGRLLRELPEDLPGVPAALRQDLAGACTRVVLARRFYNDAVRDTRVLRLARLPRLLRLHARRPLPRFFDIDDRLGDVFRSAGGAGRSIQ